MKITLTHVLGIVLGLTMAVAAGADTVRLNNGSILIGTVVSQTQDGVVLRVGQHMRLELDAREIAGIDRANSQDNQQLRAAWKDARPPVGASVTPEPDANQTNAPGKQKATEEQQRRKDALDGLDLIEETITPEILSEQIGPPQERTSGQTASGQAYQDWSYEVGPTQIRTVRFLRTARADIAVEIKASRRVRESVQAN